MNSSWVSRALQSCMLVLALLLVCLPAQAITVHYDYDQAYNRTGEIVRSNDGTLIKQLKYHYDTAGRLTAIENLTDPSQTETFGYDANGNQTSRTVGSTVTAFGFDARDQLSTITQSGSNQAPTVVARYRYNADGMRSDGEENGQLRRYTWDDERLLRVQEPDNSVSRYNWGANRVSSLVSTQDGSTRRDWYFYDALGSVTALVSDAGELTASYRFDAFGKITERAGDSKNRFTYTGHQYDGISGLYYFKARYYDPAQGRFISEDSYEGTVATPESRNGYLYAYANPLVYVDADGNVALLANGRDALMQFDGWLANQSAQYGDGVIAKIGVGATAVSRGLVQGSAGLVSLVNIGANTGSVLLNKAGVVSDATAAAHSDELGQSVAAGVSLAKDLSRGSDSQAYQSARATVSAAYEGDNRALSDVGSFGVGFVGGGVGTVQGASAMSRGVAAAGRTGQQAAKKISTTAQVATQRLAQKAGELASKAKETVSRRAADVSATKRESALPDRAPQPQFQVAEAADLHSAVVTNRTAPVSVVQQNNLVGNSFDEYVVGTKLRGLDERGLLVRQERLPTPDIDGSYVKPDYSIYGHDGKVVAYADAKTGTKIPFDAQARGLIEWSKGTKTKTLIYYTPEGTTEISPHLLNYARQAGVVIKQVGVE